jgi:circadian clock protein KaiC
MSRWRISCRVAESLAAECGGFDMVTPPGARNGFFPSRGQLRAAVCGLEPTDLPAFPQQTSPTSNQSPMTISSPPAPAGISSDRAPFGVQGLDDVLGGGLPENRLYLLDGEPGTGKTTLALQFLLEGRARGERGLYVTLSETADELTAAAASHEWSLEGIELVELTALQGEAQEEAYTLFHPSEIELQHTVEAVLAEVERHNPSRVVFDSLSEMRMLARDALRFRRQILALKQFFAGRKCTVLLLDDRTHPEGDLQLQSLAHGVIMLERVPMDYGAERRRLEIKKLRGVSFYGGYHDFRILTGGAKVYPRLRRHAPTRRSTSEILDSGSPELEALLGGGVHRGTSLLVTGAAGTGKSVIATQYALAASERGEKVRMFMFDERIETAQLRASALGLDTRECVKDGRLVMQQIEPTQMSPGEFSYEVVEAVEKQGVSVIVIDSINGLMNAMPAERLINIQVHELLSYLSDRGVTVIMTLVQRGIFGVPVEAAMEISYLADSVILLRYFEHAGAVRRAISVVKKRSGTHEQSIREFQVGEGGPKIGEPLADFRGVLGGFPEYVGGEDPLMNTGGD